MKILLTLAGFLIWSTTGFAQKGKVEGKVTDQKTGNGIPGVSVSVNGAKATAATNIDGVFVLNLEPGKKYIITLSSVGYASKELADIEVNATEVTHLDLVLAPASKTEAAVVVRSSARKETAAALITFQKNTNTVASVISAEAIRRSPDKNTGEILKRTPGASIQEGRFIVVRGLADRYNQAMLNGILLSSTEPDRKTFSFDMLPASMIDNIVINKAFVPELPGEWAGGLIQVNTKDIPAKNFFNIQLGTGFNTQTIGKDFYKDKGGSLDWLGIDDGARSLPSAYTTKSKFEQLSAAEKIAIGKSFTTGWTPVLASAPINTSFQLNGGFNTKWFGKKVGFNLGLNYNKTNLFQPLVNRLNKISNGQVSIESDFNDERSRQNVSAGALASMSVQFNSYNKVSVKSILNVNTLNYVTQRSGTDVSREDFLLNGTEFTFKQNTFFTVQANGEHNLKKELKLKWYGAFNILDGYVPDQRRILYSRRDAADPYRAVISNTLSQQSGSRIYQSLNDYIYTTGGDLAYNFNLFNQKQVVKAGYMLQIKDRLFDAQLFANYLPRDNDALRLLPADQIFAAGNFGDGSANSTLFAFDALKGKTYRYLANTILNAGFVQFDNQFSKNLRVVWGLRVEHYDQLVGSTKKSDPRFTNSVVTDYLPGVNFTYKVNEKTNLRLSGSQTVIRPELRELSFLNLYDFELNASVQGNPNLERTKVSNIDLRYEFYPRGGETFSLGAFYKFFDKPIEQIFNEGSGGSSTFNYQNPKEANTFGVELEFRKKLDFNPTFKNFTFQANGAYINSTIKDVRFNVDRPLQGQSPYVVNLGLLYDLEKAGFNATLLFNQIGERIYLVGDISAGAASPDIYEAPRALLDLQLAKKILKNKGELRFNISDILNQTQIFYQNVNDSKTYQSGTDAIRFSRKYGTTFGLTFNYSL